MSVLLILAISVIVLWALYRNDTENFENKFEYFIQGEEITQEEMTQEENDEFVGPFIESRVTLETSNEPDESFILLSLLLFCSSTSDSRRFFIASCI